HAEVALLQALERRQQGPRIIAHVAVAVRGRGGTFARRARLLIPSRRLSPGHAFPLPDRPLHRRGRGIARTSNLGTVRMIASRYAIITDCGGAYRRSRLPTDEEAAVPSVGPCGIPA